MDQESRQETPQSPKNEALARMVRLTWKMLGMMVIILLLILIVIASPGSVPVLDVLFWLAVAGIALARFMDAQVFHGLATDEKPATVKDVVNYTLGLTMMSGFFWILAHALKNRLQ